MNKVDVTQKADIRCFLGAPGTGKSHATMAEMMKAKRLVVWDLEDEYTQIETVTVASLPRRLHQAGAGGFKVRIIPSTDAGKRQVEFDLVCRTIMEVGKLLFVAEELRFVTQPSKAPAGWAAITLRGRKRGVKVIGTSQRPASIDKDFLGSATTIRCGALNYPEDRKAVAAVMGIDPEEIEKLEGYQAILWTRTPRTVKRV
jgi:hypothetical protein